MATVTTGYTFTGFACGLLGIAHLFRVQASTQSQIGACLLL